MKCWYCKKLPCDWLLLMQILQHTKTKLIFRSDENQILFHVLSVGGVFAFAGIVMFGADFRVNPDYDIVSANNLNFFIKMLGGISILIGLSFGLAGINNRDNTYIFDKETSVFNITGRGWSGLYTKAYPLSSIKEVTLNKVSSAQPDTLPDGYSYSSVIPNDDEFFITLGLEDEMVSETIFLLYRSSNFQLMNDFRDTIRRFLEIDA